VANKEWGATINGVDVWPLNYTVTRGNYGPGQGDSGGPVFSLTPDLNRIVAKGTISAGFRSAQVPCQGENWPGRLCSNAFLYFETALAQLALGTQIVTG
jgi:hypothetical protein